jgi:DNA repair exonuclease SbcCD ATPase subunit
VNARKALVAPLRPLLRGIQTRIDNAVRAAEERGEQRLQVVAAELRGAQDAEAAEQHRVRDVRLGEVSDRIDELDDQLRRISAQLVAVERRVGDLERPAVALAADDADRREARSLVEEVRLEHDRAQAGLAAISFYEERIARLERAADLGVNMGADVGADVGRDVGRDIDAASGAG